MHLVTVADEYQGIVSILDLEVHIFKFKIRNINLRYHFIIFKKKLNNVNL